MISPQPIAAPFTSAAAQRLHESLTGAASETHGAREKLLCIAAADPDPPPQLHSWVDQLTRIESQIIAAAEPLNAAILDAAEEESTG